MKFAATILLTALLLVSGGCASLQQDASSARSFSFPQDAFAHVNELFWEYDYNQDGNWEHRRRDVRPEYAHHCFVMARSAKQFLLHARFEPDQPAASEATYRWLIREVVRTSPRRRTPPARRVVIPGYRNLREFSAAHETLLKSECGGAWRSYVQRGNWRMVFPFSRSHQEKMARKLVRGLEQNQPAVVHLVRFPDLTINHAILLFEAGRQGTEVRFTAYDPNNAGEPVELIFDNDDRTFHFPANHYFPGGPVDVYEIYRSVFY